MEGEGEGKTSPLYTLDNFCVLPHTGGHNLRARNAMIMRCAKNIVEFFEDGIEPPFQLQKTQKPGMMFASGSSIRLTCVPDMLKQTWGVALYDSL